MPDSRLSAMSPSKSHLTLGDIKLIRASFIETLKGRFHVRVKYPGNEELEVDEEEEENVADAPLPPVLEELSVSADIEEEAVS